MQWWLRFRLSSPQDQHAELPGTFLNTFSCGQKTSVQHSCPSYCKLKLVCLLVHPLSQGVTIPDRQASWFLTRTISPAAERGQDTQCPVPASILGSLIWHNITTKCPCKFFHYNLCSMRASFIFNSSITCEINQSVLVQQNDNHKWGHSSISEKE